MDNTKKFDNLAAAYTSGRPAYPETLFEFLYAKLGFSTSSVIADIGSGTGKFSKGLLEKGNTVYCVEPNCDMRQEAERLLSKYIGFHSIAGDAANTTLPVHSVDFITVAQAFHWFDVQDFKTECRRILKNNGKVLLIWNIRDIKDEINCRCFEIYKTYCPNFNGFGGGIEKDDERIREFFDNKFSYMSFSHPLRFTSKAQFLNRSLSGSYSLREGHPQYAEYIQKLSDLFDQYAKNGTLTISNDTLVYYG